MKQGDYRITVEWIQNGQPRAYADTYIEFVMFCEWIPYGKTELEPAQWQEAVILCKAQGVRSFKTKEEKPAWHESILTFVKNVGPGRWHIKITEAYTD